MDLNFPSYLDIQPSVSSNFELEEFACFCPEAQTNAIRQVGLAGRVWEAAYALCAYLNPPPSLVFAPLFESHSLEETELVIELGAGSGLVSFNASRILKSPLIVTDLPEVCPILRENLAFTSGTVIRPLSWGNESHISAIVSEFLLSKHDKPQKLRYVLCSDLIYFPELFAPLLRSLFSLTAPPFCGSSPEDQPNIIISYKIRSLPKESSFWSIFGLWFSFYPISVVNSTDQPLSWDPSDTFLFSAHRKPESKSWNIPPNDAELMAGMGAAGDMRPKGDDTFESFLFMSMTCDIE